MSQQCTLATKKAKCILDCIGEKVSRSRIITLHIYLVFVRPHLEHCTKFWTLQNKKDMDTLAQQRATNMVRKLDHMTYHGRLQLREKKAQGRPYCCLQLPDHRIQR